MGIVGALVKIFVLVFLHPNLKISVLFYIMVTKIAGLTQKDSDIFMNVAFNTRENAFPLDKISGSGTKDEKELKAYMNIFERHKFYKQDEDGDYVLTDKGLRVFNKGQKY